MLQQIANLVDFVQENWLHILADWNISELTHIIDEIQILNQCVSYVHIQYQDWCRTQMKKSQLPPQKVVSSALKVICLQPRKHQQECILWFMARMSQHHIRCHHFFVQRFGWWINSARTYWCHSQMGLLRLADPFHSDNPSNPSSNPSREFFRGPGAGRPPLGLGSWQGIPLDQGDGNRWTITTGGLFWI